MKVTLIFPDNANRVHYGIGNLIEEQGVMPPLGLLYLAGYLKKHTPHDVEVIDRFDVCVSLWRNADVIYARQELVVD